eukprot:3775392-Rhodomonas_salina.1
MLLPACSRLAPLMPSADQASATCLVGCPICLCAFVQRLGLTGCKVLPGGEYPELSVYGAGVERGENWEADRRGREWVATSA